jgi:hypothetical protein
MSLLTRIFSPETIAASQSAALDERSSTVVGSSNAEPLTAFEVSSRQSTLNARIQSHSGHTVFEYVTIQPGDGRTKTRLLKYLQTLSSRLYKEPVEIKNVPILNLIDRTHVYQFSDCIKPGAFKHLLDWITIYEVGVIFSPAQGFYQDKSGVTVSIRDNRFSKNQNVQTVKLSSNVQTKFVMSLDYAVKKDDLHDVTLIIDNPVSAIKEGRYWGSLKVEMSILQSDTAMQSSVVAPMGVIEMSSSALVKHKHNPTTLDLDISQSNLEALINMRKKGLIRDLSQTTKSKQMVENFGGSEAGSDRESENEKGEEEDSDSVDEHLKTARNTAVSNSTNNWVKAAQNQFPRATVLGNTNSGIGIVEKPEDLSPKEEGILEAIKENNAMIDSKVGEVVILKSSMSSGESKGKKKEVGFKASYKERLVEMGVPKNSLSNYPALSPLAYIVSNIFPNLVRTIGNEISMKEFIGLKGALESADAETRNTSIFYDIIDSNDFMNCADSLFFADSSEMSIAEFYDKFFDTNFFMTAS